MKLIYGLIIAFGFLTRLPIAKKVDWNKENISIAIPLFSVVGLVMGTLLYIIIFLLKKTPLIGELNALIILFTWLILTGGLHMDGLSDLVDALSSNSDRNRILEIMSDSHIGAFGVISIVMQLLSKYILLLGLINYNCNFLMSLIIPRLMASYAIINYDTAKKNGFAAFFKSSVSRVHNIYTAIVGVFSFIIALIITKNMVINLAASLITIIFLLLFYHSIDKKLGGLTGDVYGASVEIGESVYLSILFILRLCQI